MSASDAAMCAWPWLDVEPLARCVRVRPHLSHECGCSPGSNERFLAHATHAREARRRHWPGLSSKHAAAEPESIEREPVPGFLPECERLAVLGGLLLGVP